MKKTAEVWKDAYETMKSQIITDIWFLIKDREDATLDITEEKGIPALVTGNFDDQESETICDLVARKDKVIAIATSYYDNDQEYDLDEWEVPFLVTILDSVEKHLELEEKKK